MRQASDVDYQAQRAELDEDIKRIREAATKPGYCRTCGGSGKVDRGNGATKPCNCTAGLIERARRRSLRAKE